MVALGAFVGLSIGLPVAFTGLAKALVLILAAVTLARRFVPRLVRYAPGSITTHAPGSTVLLMLSLLALALSAGWSLAPWTEAGHAWVKHAKLLLIPALPLLLREERSVRAAWVGFVVGQSVVLLSSWLLWIGLELPWVTAPPNALAPSTRYVVFSSYLDQGVMLASSAAVLWQLAPRRWFNAATLWAVAALAHVLLVLEGRTGYVVALVLLALALWWGMPGRTRWLAWVPSLVLGVLVVFGSTQTQERLELARQEAQAYMRLGEADSSAGFRLNAWRLSVLAIKERPLIGYGVGAWPRVAFQAAHPGQPITGEVPASNPHQEFLLWGVELGLAGILLLAGCLLRLGWEARRYASSVRQACWSVLVALVLTSLLNCALYDALIGDYFCILLGLLIARARQAQPAPDAT